jgi:hypothetical protein
MSRVKMGGKEALRVFLAGGEDLSRPLLEPGASRPRLRASLAAALRDNYGTTCTLEFGHEPGGRSDVLLQLLDAPPEPQELAQYELSRGGRGLWDGAWDIVVLTLESEISASPWRHRQIGYLAYAHSGVRPPASDFEPAGPLAAACSKQNLSRLIAAAKERLDAHVLIFNCSSIDPDDNVHNYHGREDTTALRIHRLNLALMELSCEAGISIIDVERLISEMGGEQHVKAACRYSDEAYEAIGQEFLRVLADIGFFENRPLILQIGQKGK